MGAPIYSPVNLVSRAAAFSASPEDFSFLAQNIGDGRVGRVARLTSATGYWQVDLGSVQAPSFVAVMGHNLAADAVLRLEWSSSAAVWTPLVNSLLLTVGTTGETWRTFVPIAARYWRLTVVSGGTSPSLAQVGEWWLGQHVALSGGWAWGAASGRDAAAVSVRSEHGVASGYHLADWRVFEGGVRAAMGDGQAAELAALRSAGRFGAAPICFAPDSAVSSQVLVGRVRDGGFRHSRIAPGLWSGGEIFIAEDAFARTG